MSKESRRLLHVQTVQGGGTGQKSWDPAVSDLPALCDSCTPLHPAFYMGSGELNSGSHACLVTLLTEPSSQFLLSFYHYPSVT